MKKKLTKHLALFLSGIMLTSNISSAFAEEIILNDSGISAHEDDIIYDEPILINEDTESQTDVVNDDESGNANFTLKDDDDDVKDDTVLDKKKDVKEPDTALSGLPYSGESESVVLEEKSEGVIVEGDSEVISDDYDLRVSEIPTNETNAVTDYLNEENSDEEFELVKAVEIDVMDGNEVFEIDGSVNVKFSDLENLDTENYDYVVYHVETDDEGNVINTTPYETSVNEDDNEVSYDTTHFSTWYLYKISKSNKYVGSGTMKDSVLSFNDTKDKSLDSALNKVKSLYGKSYLGGVKLYSNSEVTEVSGADGDFENGFLRPVVGTAATMGKTEKRTATFLITNAKIMYSDDHKDESTAQSCVIKCEMSSYLLGETPAWSRYDQGSGKTYYTFMSTGCGYVKVQYDKSIDEYHLKLQFGGVAEFKFTFWKSYNSKKGFQNQITPKGNPMEFSVGDIDAGQVFTVHSNQPVAKGNNYFFLSGNTAIANKNLWSIKNINNSGSEYKYATVIRDNEVSGYGSASKATDPGYLSFIMPNGFGKSIAVVCANVHNVNSQGESSCYTINTNNGGIYGNVAYSASHVFGGVLASHYGVIPEEADMAVYHMLVDKRTNAVTQISSSTSKSFVGETLSVSRDASLLSTYQFIGSALASPVSTFNANLRNGVASRTGTFGTDAAITFYYEKQPVYAKGVHIIRNGAGTELKSFDASTVVDVAASDLVLTQSPDAWNVIYQSGAGTYTDANVATYKISGSGAYNDPYIIPVYYRLPTYFYKERASSDCQEPKGRRESANDASVKASQESETKSKDDWMMLTATHVLRNLDYPGVEDVKLKVWL